jgi:hypothetical protein
MDDIWYGVGIAVLTVILDKIVDKVFIEPSRTDTMLKSLLSELRDNKKRAEENRQAVREEMNKLDTTEVKTVPVLPLDDIGWESLRSTGVIASQDTVMVTSLTKAYAAVATHNQIVLMRNGIVSSSLSGPGRISLVNYYDQMPFQKISELLPQLDPLEKAVKEKVGETT